MMLQIKLPAGYNSALKKNIKPGMATVLSRLANVPVEVALSWIQECHLAEGKQGDAYHAPLMAAADPAALIADYLQTMQLRQLERAQHFLAPNFVMTFPGSGEMTSLEQLLKWAQRRYRHVQKTISSINVAHERNHVLVFVHGMLNGQWLSGSTFKNVRFIDRFEIRNGLLVRQDVWNDLANAEK